MFKTLKDFYNSDEFANTKQLIMSERIHDDGFLYCEHCGKKLIHKYDIIAHHKTELTEQNMNDYMVSLNPELIMMVHFSCHNQIHARFGYENKKVVFIIYGAPCSGKTSWVYDIASPNDLIVDMDSIFEMISSNPRYIKPNRLLTNVFAVRDLLYDQIKYRNGKWEKAYVIGGFPMQMERERLEKRLNATSIFIEADKETCMERAKNRPNYTDTIKYINDWFGKFNA